jgi:hypothetical protein
VEANIDKRGVSIAGRRPVKLEDQFVLPGNRTDRSAALPRDRFHPSGASLVPSPHDGNKINPTPVSAKNTH